MKPFPTLFSIALFSAAAAGCQKAVATAQPDAAAPAKVDGNRITLPADTAALTTAVAETARQTAATRTHLNGRLVWNEDATVRVYSPVAGRVRSVLANVGDHIDFDGPLARIDSPDFGQAQADARKADAGLMLARRTLERTRELFAHGAAPQKDVETAEDAAAGAEAEQQRAASRLALFGSRQAGAVDQAYVLRSPLAGTVVERNLNLGQEIRPDLMLANAPQLLAPQFVVSDPSRLWVLLDVTEMDIGLLKPGQSLRISTRALPGRTFEGRLESIGSSLDPTTRIVKARGAVDNGSLLLKAEMYVDVEVDVDGSDQTAVAVASPAVVSKDDRQFVFVETKPNVYERREVQVGAEASGKVLLLNGVRPGERVLVEGSLLVEQLLESGGSS